MRVIFNYIFPKTMRTDNSEKRFKDFEVGEIFYIRDYATNCFIKLRKTAKAEYEVLENTYVGRNA